MGCSSSKNTRLANWDGSYWGGDANHGPHGIQCRPHWYFDDQDDEEANPNATDRNEPAHGGQGGAHRPSANGEEGGYRSPSQGSYVRVRPTAPAPPRHTSRQNTNARAAANRQDRTTTNPRAPAAGHGRPTGATQPPAYRTTDQRPQPGAAGGEGARGRRRGGGRGDGRGRGNEGVFMIPGFMEGRVGGGRAGRGRR
ncbi:hypothetical protein MMC12_006872 [Toensbergia leucococca]|nr:hypothetical protein [Toensbergia leucococca]